MTAKNWRERLTSADWANWRYAYDRWAEHDARDWATNPNNRNLAQGMYGQASIREPDATRGCVSPICGVATSKETKQ